MTDFGAALAFEWHEEKRLRNIERHGLDFIDVGVLFAGSVIVGDAKTVEGEARKLATGLIGDVYVTAVYTVRDDRVRVISLRRARDGERRRHQALCAG